MSPSPWDKAFKPIIALSALIIAFTVGYYFLVFVPQIQREKEQAMLKRQHELDDCLSQANSAYQDAWASKCWEENRTFCLLTLSVKTCDGLFPQGGMPSNTNEQIKHCSLPANEATYLNDMEKTAKDECYRRHPLN